MGNAFNSDWIGDYPFSGFKLRYYPDVTPCPFEDAPSPKTEKYYATDGRKAREMRALEEEMRSAKLPLEDRDFCAHLLLKYMACRKEKFPFVVFCSHEKHVYLNCKYDDFLIRMKEYERERRLMVIDKRKKECERGK
ncbi:unnamed protein product [Brassicogethes aeneus]|uniref:NADH dehydrogenase [ubiquinone] 1 beta subcomplex subunit 7 n=1 Tax=Brassicogethes aeneus TaxID=1431903 RepID=A0A9P0FAM5_BRAAE|nr:unnamed protein product [Brassicogethes aeneus]